MRTAFHIREEIGSPTRNEAGRGCKTRCIQDVKQDTQMLNSLVNVDIFDKFS